MNVEQASDGSMTVSDGNSRISVSINWLRGTIEMMVRAGATTGTQLAARTVARKDWGVAGAYVVHELPFTLDASRAGHSIELRTFFLPNAYVRIDKIGYR